VQTLLQATIYDAACLCLAAIPELAKIAISTPNLHYLPTTSTLKALGVVADTT
jgi:urate oxidase